MGDWIREQEREDIRWERYMAWLNLRTVKAEVRPTAQAVWWILGATEKRVEPIALARRLDRYVAAGADRSAVWVAVAAQLRWARRTRFCWRQRGLPTHHGWR